MSETPRIDWAAIRAMIEAPAYLQRIGAHVYQSPEERVQAFGGGQLTVSEIAALNKARAKALKRRGKPEDYL